MIQKSTMKAKRFCKKIAFLFKFAFPHPKLAAKSEGGRDKTLEN